MYILFYSHTVVLIPHSIFLHNWRDLHEFYMTGMKSEINFLPFIYPLFFKCIIHQKGKLIKRQYPSHVCTQRTPVYLQQSSSVTAEAEDTQWELHLSREAPALSPLSSKGGICDLISPGNIKEMQCFIHWHKAPEFTQNQIHPPLFERSNLSFDTYRNDWISSKRRTRRPGECVRETTGWGFRGMLKRIDAFLIEKSLYFQCKIMLGPTFRFHFVVLSQSCKSVSASWEVSCAHFGGDLGTLLIPLVLFTILSSRALLPHLSHSPPFLIFPHPSSCAPHSDLLLSKKFKILSERCTPKADVTCKRNFECVIFFNTQLLKCIIVEKLPSIDKYSVNTSGAPQEFRMIDEFTHLRFYLTSILLFWTSFCSCFIFYPLPRFHQRK